MRSQFGTASKRNIRHLPVVLTEHGALMAANTLNNPRAVAMSVYVFRAFVKMRLAFGANGVLCILHSALFILLDPRRNRPNRKLASI